MKDHTVQFEEGLRLLGNRVRFWYRRPGTGVLCTCLHDDGMVEIEGFSGMFAPRLFEIDGERIAVPVMGKVE